MPNSASLVFDGVNDSASTPDAAALDLVGDWTVECWFKDELGANYNHAAAALLGKADSVSPENCPYLVWIEFNDLTVRYASGFSNGQAVYGIGATSHGAWHHFAATFTAGTKVIRIYVDGTLVVTSAAQSPSPAANATALYVGSLGSGTYWDGKLDEVRIWSVVRSASEISTYKDVQAAGSETGLVACWRANEGSGTTVADLAGTAQDLTLSGATWSTVDFPTLTDAGGGPASPFPLPREHPRQYLRR